MGKEINTQEIIKLRKNIRRVYKELSEDFRDSIENIDSFLEKLQKCQEINKDNC